MFVVRFTFLIWLPCFLLLFVKNIHFPIKLPWPLYFKLCGVIVINLFLYSLPVLYIFILMLVPDCLNYSTFTVNSQFWTCAIAHQHVFAYRAATLCSIPLVVTRVNFEQGTPPFGFYVSFLFNVNFRISLVISIRKFPEILIEFILNI